MRLRSGNIKKCKPACTKNEKVQIRQPMKRSCKTEKTVNCHKCDKIMRRCHIQRHMKACTINRVLAAANKVQIRCSTKKYGKKSWQLQSNWTSSRHYQQGSLRENRNNY